MGRLGEFHGRGIGRFLLFDSVVMVCGTAPPLFPLLRGSSARMRGRGNCRSSVREFHSPPWPGLLKSGRIGEFRGRRPGFLLRATVSDRGGWDGPPGPPSKGGERGSATFAAGNRRSVVASFSTGPPGPPLCKRGKSSNGIPGFDGWFVIRTILSIHENTKLAGGVAMGISALHSY